MNKHYGLYMAVIIILVVAFFIGIFVFVDGSDRPYGPQREHIDGIPCVVTYDRSGDIVDTDCDWSGR